MENTTIIIAGGMDITVTGNNIKVQIDRTIWKMSVAEFESMLESHQLLKDACKQMVNVCSISAEKEPPLSVSVNDITEFINGITSAKEALRRAD